MHHERAYPQLPQRSSRVPLIAAGAIGAAIASTAIVYIAARDPAPPPASKSQPEPNRAATAQEPAAIAPTVPPATPESPRAPPKEAAPSADIEPGPVTLIWTGRVRQAMGAAPRPGSACTLTARVTSNGNVAGKDLLSLQCGGQVLYDSSLPLEGMSSSGFGVGEQPLAGQVRAYQYIIEAQDIGARAGPKAQISTNSRSGVVEAFRDTAPSFRVSVALTRDSQVRRGRPLLTETIPAFEQVVSRTLKVVSRTGAVPFRAPTCNLVIAPAYAKGHTCRVTLTCQGKVLYGAGTSGYVHCLIDNGQPTSFLDANPTPSGGDPQLQVDLTANTATLGDTLTNGASYLVQFSLKP